ncbi:MAG: tRNA 5-methoxyuridine(34)/uridine 5-oxyacetic acid(34) synthase CmoB [Spirochaetales bacterium]|nr:tRNA 5-methoxyuridine(34)/uridine 5-oxyacetic acid(34) synthase CmoB [Spirochaetales bacterium]
MTPDYSRWYSSRHPYNRFGRELARKEDLLAFRKAAGKALNRDHNTCWRAHLGGLKPHPETSVDFSGDTVRFGLPGQLAPEQSSLLVKALEDLRFWRKGPFEYFGTRVDAEWQSNIKWQRVCDLIGPDLRGKTVCDIGCNNLYYMYRMLEADPQLVIGIEPMEKYFFHHYLNSLYYVDPRLHFELMGIDDLDFFEGFFDVVFCMGILYHRRNPLLSLERMAAGMKKGALLVMETAGIPGDGPYCLFPHGRYMKAPGWWFLPTREALRNMLGRTGFSDVEFHGVFDSSIEEQRVTQWTTNESLAEFLDPEDPSKTVEGYPAAQRMYLSARKR